MMAAIVDYWPIICGVAAVSVQWGFMWQKLNGIDQRLERIENRVFK